MDSSATAHKDRHLDPELNRLTSEVIGAAIEVHRTLGPGLLEPVYQNAMAIELSSRQIPFLIQVPVCVSYKGHVVGKGRMDVLIADCLILEVKAVAILSPIHTAQVIAYLKITGKRLALLINFNEQMLKDGIKRIAN
jgi:GxxExxY protein